ncbi:hypothetical protein MNEG_7080 [Monoraphidium neglectum]|uniref:Ribosomal protein eL8/eL30/eS12/Gadd45 domain-containing protein n=1 Tax=Monoraphidium neglectum TaxID=145388 RepID=A0A0D2MCA4_9CHLO|nr:hypothetical protein MNEG_7080 [Monoraphidium neglectum]KIZ00880.1 hypothetical protein MNEG_7080 [Monoraphidium neglectum]|eukprot:XP_013899899.1 hypothetical protein MNEG_7080 [Monoraphidium neglectum]
MREVRKAVKSGKTVAVVIAPNIDLEQAESEALEEQITGILDASSASAVPVVFALSRKRLGEIWGFRKRMSAVAILDAGGCDELLARVLALARQGRARWESARDGGGGARVPAPAAPAADAVPSAAGAPSARVPPQTAPVAQAAAAASSAQDDDNDDDALL